MEEIRNYLPRITAPRMARAVRGFLPARLSGYPEWRLVLTMLLVPPFLQVFSGCGSDAPPDLPVWNPEDHTHPDVESDGRAAPSGREMSEEESVALLWVEACATCHGRSGRGDGPAAPADAEMQDLTAAEWQTATSDEAIATVIQDGRELMPAYGPNAPRERRLNQLGIRALVRHIRRLGPAAPDGNASGEPEREAPPTSARETGEAGAEPTPVPTVEPSR